MSVVASFFYVENGKEVGRVDRVEPGRDGRAKEFFPYVALPSGGFAEKPGLNGTTFPLYRVDEVRAAVAVGGTIYFGEGEGKCDSLHAALREVAPMIAVTTIQGGANAPMKGRHLEALAGASGVIVLADSDRTGREAAKKRARAIASAYPECDVRVVDLYPERSDGSDVANWLGEGYTLDEIHVIAEASQRYGAAAKLTPSDSGGFVRAYDLASQADDATPWLVENRIPYGGTAIIAGKPKTGKTTVSASIGLAVSRGNDAFGGSTRKGPVLYVALEGAVDEWKKVLRRLGVRPEDDFFFFLGRAPLDAVQWLRENIEKHAPVLVIVDPLQRFTRVKESNSYSEVSNATDSLIELARESGAALMFTHHAGKSEKSDAIDAPIGSTAIAGAFDSVFVIKRNGERRTIQSVQRYGEDLLETILAMDPSTGSVALAGSKVDADLSEMRAAIEAYLWERVEASPEDRAVDEPTIDKNVEGRTKIKRDALRELVADGRVERSGLGKRGDPFHYAVSCSLVPTYGREQENENPKTDENSDAIRADSCSDHSREVTSSGTRVPAEQNHNPLADDLFAYAAERIPPLPPPPTQTHFSL
jgi:5S rRNA maturation endonuclease (ribonuclease M5)